MEVKERREFLFNITAHCVFAMEKLEKAEGVFFIVESPSIWIEKEQIRRIRGHECIFFLKLINRFITGLISNLINSSKIIFL